MSWSGFKKNVGRATTQVMMKTGHVEKTSDRDYEVEERRYRTLESASLRLQKEAKGYLDSLRAMTASQMRIAETIDAFYGESGAKDGVSRSYKQAVEDLDAETVKALDGPYRCVTREPAIVAMVQDDQRHIYPPGVLEEIEAELNWKRGDREYTKDFLDEQNESLELIEFVYRTTVLEPINRFCAYFPDINECIKKRNHKMLDYDSMRSKVKKLTEKPDKDPSKLPRTEKETEMVKADALSFLRFAEAPSDLSAFPAVDESLLVPSPPKALDGLKHPDRLTALKADEDAALRSIGMKRTSSIMSTASRLNRAFWGMPSDTAPGQHPALATPSSRDRKASLASAKSLGASSTDASPNSPSLLSVRGGGMIPPVSPHSTHSPTMPKFREHGPDDTPTRKTTLTVPANVTSRTSPTLELPTTRKRGLDKTPGSPMRGNSPASSRKLSGSTLRPSIDRNTLPSEMSKATAQRPTRTPFFHPSELEEIMAPLKAEFIERQADELGQAKAAYLQLNEQLTNELPQLIDLRVPYLDPSFEALVKIQLRFCAEAYSRMAQVQQYLDASTRDQYANGDLDARVEDVLGQIRELSIAGTV